MAVLVEAISVIIKNDAIVRCFGSLDKITDNPPNNTLCFDEFITRIGFMTPTDVGVFVRYMEKYGMTHISDGKAVDIWVIDQITGPTSECDWAEFGTAVIFNGDYKIKICTHKDEDGCSLRCPNGWEYENSLSKNGQRMNAETVNDNMEYVGTDGKTETWVNKKTGKKMYIGRTSNLL